MSALAGDTTAGLGEPLRDFDPLSPLTPSGNLRRRKVINRGLEGLARTAAALAVLVLALVTLEVIQRGAGQISFSFLTTNAASAGGTSGGIIGPILGTVLIVALGAVIAVPVGVLCAIYLTEFASPGSRPARLLRMVLDLLQGLPTVVVGLFVFGLMVEGSGETGLAGAVALSIVMLPLIARSSQEVLRVIPGTLREATDALGVERWRGVLTVILPSAMGGILTGSILAIARAAGETAPLLIVDGLATPGTHLDLFGQGVPNIPVFIFQNIDNPDPQGLARAWGAALILLAVILMANIGARVLLARSRRRMGL